MKGSIALTALAAALCAGQAVAQERTRSTDYAASTALGCTDWQVGFAFESCTREPVPGSGTEVAQVYTLADGATRRLTQDPAESMAGQAAAPASITGGEETAERVRFTPRDGAARPVAPEGDTPAAQIATVAGSSIVADEFDLPPVVTMIPGDAKIVPMAVGHLNRIETPFKDPAVRTAAPSEALNIEFDGSFVYVSVTQPVTLFLHEKGHPDPALVVSLVPKRIAPRQVRLDVPSTFRAQIAANAAPAPAPKTDLKPIIGGVRRERDYFEPKFPFVAAMEAYLEGDLPAGYSYGFNLPAEASAFCQARGVRFTFDQGGMIYNREYVILRGMATSNSVHTLEEVWCARQPDTVAVAYSPRLVVGPNSPVDFFVLLRTQYAPIKTVAE